MPLDIFLKTSKVQPENAKMSRFIKDLKLQEQKIKESRYVSCNQEFLIDYLVINYHTTFLDNRSVIITANELSLPLLIISFSSQPFDTLQSKK